MPWMHCITVDDEMAEARLQRLARNYGSDARSKVERMAVIAFGLSTARKVLKRKVPKRSLTKIKG